jgi:hypothetical protein
LPPSLEQLDHHCFLGCESLLTVAFDANLEFLDIEDSIFERCPSLTAVCIPASLQTVFSEYEALLRVIVPEHGTAANDQPDAVNAGTNAAAITATNE